MIYYLNADCQALHHIPMHSCRFIRRSSSGITTHPSGRAVKESFHGFTTLLSTIANMPLHDWRLTRPSAYCSARALELLEAGRLLRSRVRRMADPDHFLRGGYPIFFKALTDAVKDGFFTSSFKERDAGRGFH